MGGCCLSLDYPKGSVTIFRNPLWVASFNLMPSTSHAMVVFLLTAECLPWDTRGSQRVAVPCTPAVLSVWAAGRIWHPDPAKAIAALRALKHITNTGQTPTGLTIHRAWPQAPHSPNAEQCRAWQGALHLLLLFGVHLLLFHLLPHWNGGLSNFSSHSHLGTSMDKLTWLVHLSLLYLLKGQMGKVLFWILLNNTRDIGDELGGTYCPWETEVEALWNRILLTIMKSFHRIFLKPGACVIS